ncbi:MAG: NTP transferase domain-containing protein [Deltaproteobacteria bacterium]|jgi:bifunctional UDP-N-acetylglucosamine pyrophosphorylase/glucosamine-1-phosphate N-acetyltransferase|nr:NTP transferase domain-containing protein [Deltaproteobacteria bacterium]
MANKKKTATMPKQSFPAVIVMAAGKGTRMKTDLPKVLHKVMGRTVISHVLNSVRYLSPERLIVVTGHGAEEVEAEIANSGAIFARQNEPRGTAHAVQAAMGALDGFGGSVVILSGDVPLISPQTLLDLLDAHEVLGCPLSVLTVRLDDPASYGRIIRDRYGWLEKIVEAREATEEELLVDEINSGIYVVDSMELRETIFNIKPNNAQKEFYLTDLVKEIRSRGKLAGAVEGPEPLEVQGINTCLELAAAQAISRARINESWLLSGVIMEDPATTYIEASVRLSSGVSLGQGAILSGNSRVGQGVSVGHYCCLHDVEIEPGATLRPHLSLSGSKVFSDGRVEPRPGLATLGQRPVPKSRGVKATKPAPKSRGVKAAKPAPKSRAVKAAKPAVKFNNGQNSQNRGSTKF